MVQRPTVRPSRRYRLVVETDDPALAISDFTCFQEAGFDVAVCHGPDAEHPCPAATGARCDAVADADVVLNALRDPAAQAVLAKAVRAAAPNVPMVVNVAPGMDAALPDGCISLSSTMSVNGQTHAVRGAAVSKRRVNR